MATTTSLGKAEPDLHPDVELYMELGWSLIHVRHKRPLRKWAHHQRRRASREEVAKFGSDIAVVHGSISGGLVSRDFDDGDTYRKWAADYPLLATTLPTVATARGMHVYCLANSEEVREVRRAFGKPVGRTGALTLGDGELRWDVGCYSAVPPADHPSGSNYSWLNRIGTAGIPTIELFSSGFFQLPAPTANLTHAVCAPVLLPGLSGGSEEDRIFEAIWRTLPTDFGQRRARLFDLARLLKGIPSLALADSSHLKWVVIRWHQLALPFIRTKSLGVTLADFREDWSNVKWPAGCQMAAVLRRARDCPLRAVEGPLRVHVLGAVCRELHLLSGESPFFLSCRKAGELLDVSHQTANSDLKRLIAGDVIAPVVKGTNKSRLATTYRFNLPTT